MRIGEVVKKILNRCRGISEYDIDYENAKILLKNDPNAILLDVRSPQEYKEGNLEKSINIPLYNLEKEVETKIKDKDCTIIVYCQSGNRSRKAINILEKGGYKNLYNLAGGLDNLRWKS